MHDDWLLLRRDGKSKARSIQDTEVELAISLLRQIAARRHPLAAREPLQEACRLLWLIVAGELHAGLRALQSAHLLLFLLIDRLQKFLNIRYGQLIGGGSLVVRRLLHRLQVLLLMAELLHLSLYELLYRIAIIFDGCFRILPYE